MIALFKDPAAIDILKEKLREGKRYSVIKLIDKLEFKMDDSLFLNFFMHPENVNLQLYQLLFNLYIKELISNKTMDDIKGKFQPVDDWEKKLADVEKRCMYKKIEIDRHLMKKERGHNEKVKDYVEEKNKMFKQAALIGRADFIGMAGINMHPKITFLVDLTEFFRLNRKIGVENAIYKKIEYVSREYFEKPERENIYLSFLDQTLFEKKSSCDSKRQKVDEAPSDKSKWIGSMIENFKACSKKRMCHDDIKKMNDHHEMKFSNLRKAVQLLQEKGHPVYFLSEVSLKYLLSELAVFEIDYVDLNNIISYRNHRVSDVILEIKKKECTDQISLFGCLTKIERDFLHLFKKIGQLNEIAIRVPKVPELSHKK